MAHKKVELTPKSSSYKNAVLTIALDDTEGDHDGFLDHSRLSDKDAIAIPFYVAETDKSPKEANSSCSREEVVYLSYDRRSQARVPPGGHLKKRGWTLQEDILAIHTVHFEKRRLRWEFQKHMKVEGLDGELDDENLLKCMFFCSPENIVTQGSWHQILQTYFQRDLKLREDRFPAISGVVTEISKSTGFTYKAGIWLEDFHRGLTWSIDGNSEKQDSYIAPSWSWASIKMPLDSQAKVDHFRPLEPPPNNRPWRQSSSIATLPFGGRTRLVK